MPTYQAFLHAADFGPTYNWQKRFLQHLQLGGPIRRWILKSPDHVYGLDRLLTVFPDAVVIQTHRNPAQVVRSQFQLTKVLEGLFARPREHYQLAMSEARKIEQILGYIIRFRDAYPDVAGQFIDVKYSELVSDPLAVVRRIYGRLDIRLTDAAAQRMQRLTLSRSRYERRGANPTSADLGLDCSAEMHRFESYCSRFEIPCQYSESR
jgi:Sulfotransferase family